MRKLALAAFLLLPAGVLAASQEEVFEKAFSMEGVSRISVQNVNGRIEATAWDRPYLKSPRGQDGERRRSRGDASLDGDPGPQDRRRDPARDRQPPAAQALRLPRLRMAQRARGLRAPLSGRRPRRAWKRATARSRRPASRTPSPVTSSTARSS